MNQEKNFSSQKELVEFKIEIQKKLDSGKLELISTGFNAKRGASIYRDLESKDYFQLNLPNKFSQTGTWKKVRNEHPLDHKEGQNYQAIFELFEVLDGNSAIRGTIEVSIEFKKTSDEESLNITLIKANRKDNYIETSIKFGMYYAFEEYFRKIGQEKRGIYTVSILELETHNIDSSSITIAYLGYLVTRRALDIEKETPLIQRTKGKFELFKLTQLDNIIM